MLNRRNPQQPETQEGGVRPWNYSWVMLGQCAGMDVEISRGECEFYTTEIEDNSGWDIYGFTPPTFYNKLLNYKIKVAWITCNAVLFYNE